MIYVGCAGWALAKLHAENFLEEGTHLYRYARRLNAVEINSSFYRPHRRQTYERWAESVPAEFRFAVKVPKEITHLRRLTDFTEPLERFLAETAGLGPKLGPLLVQLPPSLALNRKEAESFFGAMRERFSGEITCEPRHVSWFQPPAERVLTAFEVARVAADPALVPEAFIPAGSPKTIYYRMHGSPRRYYDSYSEETLDSLVRTLRGASMEGAKAWCIFDNTAAGAAIPNALSVSSALGLRPPESSALAKGSIGKSC